MSFSSDNEDEWVPGVRKHNARPLKDLDESESHIIDGTSEDEDSFQSAQQSVLVPSDVSLIAESNDEEDEDADCLPETSPTAHTVSSSRPQNNVSSTSNGGTSSTSRKSDPSVAGEIDESFVRTTDGYVNPVCDADKETTDEIESVDVFEKSVTSDSSPGNNNKAPTSSRLSRDSSTTTSTPLQSFNTLKKLNTAFDDCNVTAIPLDKRNFDVTVRQNDRKSESEESRQSSSFEGQNESPPAAKLRNHPQLNVSERDYVDDNDLAVVIEGLANITHHAATTSSKRFPFRKNQVGTSAQAYGEQLVEEYSEEDSSENLSANFDFEKEHQDSGKGDSNVQIVWDERNRENSSSTLPGSMSGRGASASEVITLSDSDSSCHEVEDLSARLNQIPLGKKTVPPRKAIFLDQLPPIENRKVEHYDPSKVRNENFFGDVRRTVTKLAETIETMPMPAEDYSDFALPPMAVQLYNHQIYGLQWLSWREREFPGGGILADEMGLGKTIMILALIMKTKLEASHENKENWIDPDEIGSCIPSRSTLVVCPLSCIMQWENEVKSKAGYGNLSVAMYHGPKRTSSAARLAQADIVLTTYQTIASDIPKDSGKSVRRSPLKRIYWHRVVLDEAHQIRNPQTVSAQAICQLTSRHRWAVTGTPVHNRPEDFYSMAKFLRMTPFDDKKVWDFWIGMKQVKKSAEARERLHILGKALILRRTKEELKVLNQEGCSIPPKTIEIVRIDMDENEKEVYEHLMKYSQSLFQNFLKNKEQKENEMQAAAMTYAAERRKKKNAPNEAGELGFSHLFALIVRLRQCAVLPYLIENMLQDEEDESDLDDSALQDEVEQMISRKNPIFAPSYMSSKIRKIVEDLEELRERTIKEHGVMEKVVIVSSWVKLLNILHEHLRRRRFSIVYITGKDNVSDRTANMERFNKDARNPQVVLLSLQAGAVGINLVGGNHVYFVEPHWNPQIELQAQDRVHRFGQKRDVFIRRYITNSTIEERILELQEQKLDLADGILANTKKARSGGLNIAQMRLLFET